MPGVFAVELEGVLAGGDVGQDHLAGVVGRHRDLGAVLERDDPATPLTGFPSSSCTWMWRVVSVSPSGICDGVRTGRLAVDVDVSVAVGGRLDHLAGRQPDLHVQVRQRMALVVLQREVDRLGLRLAGAHRLARLVRRLLSLARAGARLRALALFLLRRAVAPLVARDVEDAVVSGAVVEVVRLGDEVVPRVRADLLQLHHRAGLHRRIALHLHLGGDELHRPAGEGRL